MCLLKASISLPPPSPAPLMSMGYLRLHRSWWNIETFQLKHSISTFILTAHSVADTQQRSKQTHTPQARTNACTHTHTHTHNVYAHIHSHTHTHASTHTFTQAHTHTHTHIHSHTPPHTHTHTSLFILEDKTCLLILKVNTDISSITN